MPFFVEVYYDGTKSLFLNIYVLHRNDMNGKTVLQDTKVSFLLKETIMDAGYKAVMSTRKDMWSGCQSAFECYLQFCYEASEVEVVIIKKTIHLNVIIGIVIYSVSVISNFGGILILLHSGSYLSNPFIYYLIVLFNDILVLTFKIGFPLLIFFWDHHEFYLFEIEHLIYTSKYVYIAFFEKALKAFGAWILVLLYINKTRIILTLSIKVKQVRKIIFSVLITFILAIALHLPIALFSKYSCDYTPNRKYLFVLFARYQYWWYAVSAGFLPSIIMACCNIVIIIQMIDVQYFKIMKYPVTNTDKMGKHMYRQLFIGCTFILLTSPSLLYDALNKGLDFEDVSYDSWSTISSISLKTIYKYIFNHVYSINYSISVLVYCATGTKFRKSAISLWRKLKLNN